MLKLLIQKQYEKSIYFRINHFLSHSAYSVTFHHLFPRRYWVCTRNWQVSWLLINTPHSLPSFPVVFVICSELQLRDSVGISPTSLLSQTFIWHQVLHNIQLCYYYNTYFKIAEIIFRKITKLRKGSFNFNFFRK